MGKTVTLTEAMNIQGVLMKRMQEDIQFITQNCVRDSKFKDPLEGEGGSEKLVKERIQAFYDKLQRFLSIRKLISQKNQEVLVTIEATEEEDGVQLKQSKTLKDWLDWDRSGKALESSLWANVKRAQDLAFQQASARGQSTEDTEKKLEFAIPMTRAPKELMAIETVHSKLDAVKSVANATQTIDIP